MKKAVIEILKLNNPRLEENYYERETIGRIERNFQYDAVAFDVLNLTAFNRESIYARKIVIEVKYGLLSISKINYFLSRVENNFDVVVFIVACKKNETIIKKYKNYRCRIEFIFFDDLIKNAKLKTIIENVDDYIVKENNILISDNYPL